MSMSRYGFSFHPPPSHTIRPCSANASSARCTHAESGLLPVSPRLSQRCIMFDSISVTLEKYLRIFLPPLEGGRLLHASNVPAPADRRLRLILPAHHLACVAS